MWSPSPPTHVDTCAERGLPNVPKQCHENSAPFRPWEGVVGGREMVRTSVRCWAAAAALAFFVGRSPNSRPSAPRRWSLEALLTLLPPKLCRRSRNSPSLGRWRCCSSDAPSPPSIAAPTSDECPLFPPATAPKVGGYVLTLGLPRGDARRQNRGPAARQLEIAGWGCLNRISGGGRPHSLRPR